MNIRIVKTSDAEELVEYINKISGESNFLTFGEIGRASCRERV